MRLDAGHGLNLERAENFISAIAQAKIGTNLEIDLSQCAHVDAGAGWRLGNALRLAGSKGSLTFKVPEIDDFSGRWFQNFTRSGLGHSIARHADKIVSAGKDVTKAVKSYYAKPRAAKGYEVPSLSQYLWNSKNSARVLDLHKASLDPNDYFVLQSQLTQIFSQFEIYPEAYASDDDEDAISPIINVIFETIQNCYDHCCKFPLQDPSTVSSMLSLTRYKTINIPRASSAEFPTYIESIIDMLPGELYGFQGDFIEITVTDDGVGIAARQALDMKIYQESWEIERDTTVEAINTTATVKYASDDSVDRGDPGYGFINIRESLESLLAFCAIRSGRTFLYYTPFKADDEEELFQISDKSWGFLPGTTLQIVLPGRKRTLFSKEVVQ